MNACDWATFALFLSAVGLPDLAYSSVRANTAHIRDTRLLVAEIKDATGADCLTTLAPKRHIVGMGQLSHLRHLLATILAIAGLPVLAADTTSTHQKVDVELVQAIDASASVDDEEWRLQLAGIAAAFRDKEVLAAIKAGRTGRIAVALMSWADAAIPKDASDWFIIDSVESADTFARMESICMINPDTAAIAREWAVTLTRIPSVNGTPDEVRFSGKLLEMLAARPVLSSAKAEIWTIPVAGDALGRSVVALLIRGTGTRTAILTGHYDTVPVDDYGDLKPFALDPERLRAGLIARLRKAAGSDAEKRALADLDGGGFLPGRGLLDMKAGLAAGLAVAEAFAAEPARRGNILFLAVPDEEASSAGARQVARCLASLTVERGLYPVAAINLDSAADDGDGRLGRSVALGTVGKLLLTAFVAGQPAHACYPFAGVNAGALAGAIAAEVEWSAKLSDPGRGEPGAPPTLLSLKDSKQHYDVTTPAFVWATWNALTYGRRPENLLCAFAQACREAVAEVGEKLAVRAGAHAAAGAVDVKVIDFAALKREVVERDAGAADEFAHLAKLLANSGANLPEQCRQLTEAVWRRSGRAGPVIVVGFGSLPYLPVTLSGSANARRLAAAVTEACAQVHRETGEQISEIAFFQGISDVSYLGEADVSVLPTIASNTPVWGCGIPWPDAEGVAGVPTINAGPWGRDYHTALERLHEAYAFEVLPGLLGAILERLL